VILTKAGQRLKIRAGLPGHQWLDHPATADLDQRNQTATNMYRFLDLMRSNPAIDRVMIADPAVGPAITGPRSDTIVNDLWQLLGVMPADPAPL
jgi:hypothetical protein